MGCGLECCCFFPGGTLLGVFLSLLLQTGFSVDAELLNGRNGLHYAADYGQKEIVTFLCISGASVDVRK